MLDDVDIWARPNQGDDDETPDPADDWWDEDNAPNAEPLEAESDIEQALRWRRA